MPTYDVYEIQADGTKKWISSVSADDMSSASDEARRKFGSPIDVVQQGLSG